MKPATRLIIYVGVWIAIFYLCLWALFALVSPEMQRNAHRGFGQIIESMLVGTLARSKLCTVFLLSCLSLLLAAFAERFIRRTQVPLNGGGIRDASPTVVPAVVCTIIATMGASVWRFWFFHALVSNWVAALFTAIIVGLPIVPACICAHVAWSRWRNKNVQPVNV